MRGTRASSRTAPGQRRGLGRPDRGRLRDLRRHRGGADLLHPARRQGSGVQVQLLVWLFAMRILMVVAKRRLLLVNEAMATAQYGRADKMDYEAPLTKLVWLTSIVSVALTFIASKLLTPASATGRCVEALAIITCGTLAGAIIPEVIRCSPRRTRATCASGRGLEGRRRVAERARRFHRRELQRLWMGIVIVALMGSAYLVSNQGVGDLMLAPAVFAFGLVAFGFLGMVR